MKPAGAEEGNARHGRPRPSSVDSRRVEDELDAAEPEEQTRGRGEQRSGRNRGSCAAAVLGFLSGRGQRERGSARGRERESSSREHAGGPYAARGGTTELGRWGSRAAGAVDDRGIPVDDGGFAGSPLDSEK